MGTMSASWRIFETDQFVKDLEAISRGGRRQMAAKLREVVYPQLRDQPFFGPQIKKLKAYQPETWRYRIGSWRFFYEIDEAERIVFMIAAAHRGSAY
jgi:mRNA interferase RelE/StbE